MVDTQPMNGQTEPTAPVRRLPEAVELSATVARRIPAPGTQRALRAQTGRSFDDLCGANADGADRIQTLIWLQLRRTHPDLLWDDCADIEGIPVDDGAVLVDPTNVATSAPSPGSAGSGE